jgi:hypothetical protein
MGSPGELAEAERQLYRVGPTCEIERQAATPPDPTSQAPEFEFNVLNLYLMAPPAAALILQ